MARRAVNKQTRLVLTGGLVVIAGAHMPPNPGRATVIGVGLLILGVALYRAVMALAAQPLVVWLSRPSPAPPPQRGGLGAQNGSEAVIDIRCPYCGGGLTSREATTQGACDGCQER